jgi:hypothetical protein
MTDKQFGLWAFRASIAAAIVNGILIFAVLPAGGTVQIPLATVCGMWLGFIIALSLVRIARQ